MKQTKPLPSIWKKLAICLPLKKSSTNTRTAGAAKSQLSSGATEQWFCSIDGFKDQALKAIEGVQWIPDWGEGRISNMVKDRSDWCISRQRTWGVPIPIFYCKDCHKEYVSPGEH